MTRWVPVPFAAIKELITSTGESKTVPKSQESVPNRVLGRHPVHAMLNSCATKNFDPARGSNESIDPGDFIRPDLRDCGLNKEAASDATAMQRDHDDHLDMMKTLRRNVTQANAKYRPPVTDSVAVDMERFEGNQLVGLYAVRKRKGKGKSKV